MMLGWFKLVSVREIKSNLIKHEILTDTSQHILISDFEESENNLQLTNKKISEKHCSNTEYNGNNPLRK